MGHLYATPQQPPRRQGTWGMACLQREKQGPPFTLPLSPEKDMASLRLTVGYKTEE